MLTFAFLSFAAYLVYRQLGGSPVLRVDRKAQLSPVTMKIEELSDYARRLRASNKYTATEKIYLQILKLDHKHAPTYSRLGSLYVLLKNYADAIECLQIAAQLAPSGSTYFNLGLGYYENRNYIKAIAAFEKSIMFEPSVQHYIGAAKAYQKMSNIEKAVRMLESAVEIEPSVRPLTLLAEAYKSSGKLEEAAIVQDRLKLLNNPKPATSKRKTAPVSRSRTLEKTRL